MMLICGIALFIGWNLGCYITLAAHLRLVDHIVGYAYVGRRGGQMLYVRSQIVHHFLSDTLLVLTGGLQLFTSIPTVLVL